MATISHPTHAAHAPRFSVGRAVLWGLTLWAVVIIGIRLVNGIGAISNMVDTYSWGFWLGHKLTAVFSGGAAFTLCAAIYIFGYEKFRPLLRPAVLTGLLSYFMFIVLLFFDLGRPERIWHMIIFWNPHSPLFEVGWCVMLYTSVLIFEFLPVMFEKFHWQRAIHALHKATLPLMVFGVLLSTLHQSSLGSLMLAAVNKVHPLWHTPLIPPFFFITAIIGGISFLILEETLRCYFYKQEFRLDILSRFAKVLPWVLGLYLVLKIGDLAFAGELGLIFTSGNYSIMFVLELVLGIILPLVLYSIPAVRNNANGLRLAAGLVFVGTMFNRFSVGVTGWFRPLGTDYFPSVAEFGLSIGVLAMFILIYDYIVRNFPVFKSSEH